MADTIYLATRTGLTICRRSGDSWRVAERTLADRHVTTVIAREGVILAGTTLGIERSDDGGKMWRPVNTGLNTRHVRWMAYHPGISDLEFAGTEPAGIFISNDGAEHWNARPEVAQLRDQFGWMLPYSPHAGCVRGFDFNGQRIYAAVEVGGILRSDDGGETWALVAGSTGDPDLGVPPRNCVYPDVHDLVVHPSNPDLVVAATGGGLYRSKNGGDTWKLIYDCYCRALWLDPNDADHLVFAPADQVGSVSRFEESRDGGQTWKPASGSLRVPFPRTMPDRITQIDSELFSVLADGRLLVAPIATLDWRFILEEVSGINAVTWMAS